MSTYSILPLFSAILFFLLGVYVALFSKKNKHITFALFLNCFVTSWWQFSWAILFNLKETEYVELLIRFGYSGIIFIPITFFHLHAAFIDFHRYRKIINFYYLCGSVFLILLWKSSFFVSGYYNYFFGFYPKVGIAHPFYLIFLLISSNHGAYLLAAEAIKQKWEGIRSQQIKFLLIGFFIYYFAAADFLVNYGIEFYPLGVLAILSCLVVSCYSIAKYRLVDITIVVTKAGLILTVYMLVLGIPFYVGFKYNYWQHSTWLMLVLATSGPYVYMFFQKKAEDKLLQEQRSYQATLRKASLGMGRVKDLKRLLSLIVHVVTRTVKIEHCAIYLYHQESNQYILKASKGLPKGHDVQSILASNSPLVTYLKSNNEVIDHEEIRQKAKEFSDTKLSSIEAIMRRLSGALIIPSFIEDRLLAVIVLGKRKSGKHYSHDDMVVFSILANQSALAIENAQFYEDMKKTHKQLFEAEKMATIGTMADGLSHQINNRLHAMGFIAGDAIDTLKIKEGKFKSKEAKELSDEMKNALLKIEDNVKRGGEIVGGLLKYTRKGKEGYEAIIFDKLLTASIEMVGLKVKLSEFDIIKNYNGKLPKINGNFTQLQEVFFNLIDNAYDAMCQRKVELKEDGYRGQLSISVQPVGRNIEIIVQDNGIGVKEKDKTKLFTPFFTTKHSKMKKGTGLGLYVIRQLIERNHNGQVEFSGKYKEGATTRIVLPVV